MKTQRWVTSTLAAAALVCAAGLSSAKADTTNLVTFTTFEFAVYDPETGEEVTPAQRPPWTPYTYDYSWGYPDPAPTSYRSLDQNYLVAPDYTNTALWFSFDNSAFNPVPSNGGYGVGFGGPQYWPSKDPSILSTNKEDYILSFDARVEGLLPGKMPNVEAQMIFCVPDDTLLPADNGTDPDTVHQLNQSFQPTGDWKHFVFNLGKASYGGGTSQDMMATYRSLISEIRFAFNFHMPQDSFDFDSDNSFYLDNLKLEVVQRTPKPANPVTEQVIADWNFDDQGVGYNYPYSWTESTGFGSFTANHAAAGYGQGGSSAWIFQFDTTPFAGVHPAWAGGGSGIGGPFTPAYINTTNLAAYKVSFDARVEGLAEGKTGTSGQMQFRLRAPDDTLSPADSNTEDDTFFQVNYNVTLKSNWQTFSFTWDQGDFSSADFNNFVQFYSLTSSLQPQFQIDAAASDFGNDADNTVVIDNLKFVRLVQSLSPLSIALQGTDLVVSWSAPATGTIKLQSATSPAGPYSDVQDATSPYRVPAAGTAAQFFRTLWVP